jgi:hypothetical protein
MKESHKNEKKTQQKDRKSKKRSRKEANNERMRKTKCLNSIQANWAKLQCRAGKL